MKRGFFELLASETHRLREAGMYKREVIFSRGGGMVAGGMIDGTRGEPVINFTTHDYLGMSRDTEVEHAALAALERFGMGVSSQRVICGTLSIHKRLEERLAAFLGVDDAIVYGSGYLANVGLFPPLFGSQDCVLCDAAVHPSLVESACLAGARVVSFHNNDPQHLEDQLKRTRAARFRAIVTNGVFPYDGRVACLAEIRDLATAHGAIVVVDDCLGIGVLGERGRGATEHASLLGDIDLITGTFSKALGGASGGFTAGRSEVVEWLRQKSAPYLFSAAMPPIAAGAALRVLELLDGGQAPLAGLRERIDAMSGGLKRAGFRVLGGSHPILAVPIGEFVAVKHMVNDLYERGVYVHGLCYPLVPEGQARLRLLMSALHSDDHIERAVDQLTTAGRAAGVISK